MTQIIVCLSQSSIYARKECVFCHCWVQCFINANKVECFDIVQVFHILTDISPLVLSIIMSGELKFCCNWGFISYMVPSVLNSCMIKLFFRHRCVWNFYVLLN